MNKSKKIFFLTPYPFGKAPSQRFRFEQYYDLLNKNGITLASKSFLSNKYWEILYKDSYTFQKVLAIIYGFFKRFLILPLLPSYDIIFVHREATPVGPPIFEWFIAKILRKKIIYDFDDAIWLEDPQEKGSLLGKIKWKSKVSSICKWSYKVSVGNDYLASFARQFNDNVVINPTTIDTESLHNPKLYEKTQYNKLTIGWTGTHSTLHYLKEVIPVLKQLEKKFDFTFLVIANRIHDFTLESMIFRKWNSETEIQDLIEIDVGIMPLTNDDWTKGKCGFKALQYMALNIPTCASSVGVNTDIIQNGTNGYLCDTQEEWIEKLKTLLTNSKERKSIGDSGRETVVSHFSVKSNTANFLQLFS